MSLELFGTIVLGILGSSALWEFIRYLIERNDNQQDCGKKILDAVKDLDEKVNKLDQDLGQRTAIAARIRILRFMDEVLEGRRHTKDSYDQVNSDITTYEQYCAAHPEFKNNQTNATIAYLNKNYQERLEKKDFL